MSGTPWVSIAIPSYNREALLQRAIDSVVGQSDPDWELYIIDDMSTDGAWQRAQDAARQDTRIHAEQSQTNRGLAGNFRYASEHGTAPYLLLLAADDFLDPTFLERVHHVIENDKDVSLICGRRVHYLARNGRKRFYDTPFVGRYAAGQTTARALRYGNLYGLYSSVVVRRDALEDIGGIRSDNPWAGDYEAWTRIAARHPVYFLPQALVYQHVDGSTQTSQFVLSGRLVQYEFETLNRLLEDPHVMLATNGTDKEAAMQRIAALQWSIRLYRFATRRKGGASRVILPIDGRRLQTVFTMLELWWKRYRLTY